VVVRLFICLSHLPAVAVCGGFVAVGLAGRRYRSIAAWLVPQQHKATALHTAVNVCSATFTANVAS